MKLKQKYPSLVKFTGFNFIFGVVANLLSFTPAYPLVTVRRRMQVENALFEQGLVTKKRSFIRMCSHIYRNEGV